MKRVLGAVAATILCAVLVGGAVAVGNSLGSRQVPPVVPGGVSSAAMSRLGLSLEPVTGNPLCGLHEWAADRRLALPVGHCPITRREAIRAATSPPKPSCPPGASCVLPALKLSGLAGYRETPVDAVLSVERSGPNVGDSGSRPVVWAVSTSRACTVCTRPMPPIPLLTLIDAYSGARLLTVPAR